MASAEALQRLETRAVEAENLISLLKTEVNELQKVATVVQQNAGINKVQYENVKKENEKLKKEIEEWKKRLLQTEKSDVKPTEIPAIFCKPQSTEKKAVKTEEPVAAPETKKKEKAKPAPKEEKNKSAPAASDDLVDVRRLDIRVGKIVGVMKHPDADSLYVEQIDIGESKLRTVVSGLVKYVPIEEMKDRMVVLLCNLKPAKMRGIASEAMVLCASTPEKVEILIPPPGSVPGDRIVVAGYEGTPDAQLNPKKKIWETVAPDLKTDGSKTATYKGAPFTVPGKGNVTAPSLTGVNVK